METQPITVLLADEQRLFRQLLRAAIEAESDLEVISEADNASSAVAEVERLVPDVLVLDATLPNGGVSAATMIAERVPSCAMLVLSDEPNKQVALHALEAGASGYLSKEAPLHEVISAVRAVHRGEMQIQGQMMRPLLQLLLHRWREQGMVIRRLSRLSRREREVLCLVAKGEGTSQIAQQLRLTQDTVRTHIQNIMGKLEVHSRVDVATFVKRHNVLEELGWMLQ